MVAARRLVRSRRPHAPPSPPLKHRVGSCCVHLHLSPSPEPTPAPAEPHEELLCPICFDLLSFPITLSCGHNFDRGCLFSAWHHDRHAPLPLPPTDDVDVWNDPETKAPLPVHRCPLCRQVNRAQTSDLHVNLVLQQLIATQFPVEAERVASVEKADYVPVVTQAAPKAEAGSSITPLPSSQPRSSHTWRRTITSFLYVWAASMIESPGFILAVLLLVGLLAIALTPQHSLTTNSSTLSTVYESTDYFLGMLRLVMRSV